MISSNIDKVKHGFSSKSKQCLLLSPNATTYSHLMTKPSDESQEYQLELAARIKAIFATKPRGFKKDLADRCGVSPQSLTGWINTGKVSKLNLAILSEMTGFELQWIITGKGPKIKPTIYDLIDADHHMTTQQKSSFKALFNSVSEQNKPYDNISSNSNQ